MLEDEGYFSTLPFMKSKICNMFIIHMSIIIHWNFFCMLNVLSSGGTSLSSIGH